ncbi:MAG: hypothetical protein GY815_02895 [Gammaproteobacteria bacterium]|nr:hypothetical protein [Gammaproteobacteria bacterium]
MARFAGFTLICLLLSSPPLVADNPEEAEPAAEPTSGYLEIPFKQASEVDSGTYLQVGVVLLLMLAVAAAAILLLKKLIVDKRMLQFPNSRIRLLEGRHISSKLSLYLVEIDGHEYLLSQAGEWNYMMRHCTQGGTTGEVAE